MSDNRLNPAILERQQELAFKIQSLVHTDGFHQTAIPALKLIRASTTTEPLLSLYEPSLIMIAQGSKIVNLGNESYYYDEATYLVASVHLPITGQIIQASPEKPYLCAQLSFSTEQIIESFKQISELQMRKGETERGMAVSKTNYPLLDAVVRLVSLLETPEHIAALSPLITSEIIYRLLQDEQGRHMRQFAMMGSHAHSIAGVIGYIQSHYADHFTIQELGQIANMSVSALHLHFKKVTAMSPLQYQKLIRLQEARRLLISEGIDAAEAAFRVGYESTTQFSREYARMFGLPPIRDVKRLKNSLTTHPLFHYTGNTT
ncbi:transcriptional regulator [Paenibacillus montaniterrae]|uniref:Transcriptional regulator n=1 Tax=Paenibacillus montaniterrae TaxID=429341 RepID=A0A920CZ26_9BACL|nr:AraC family transcriptional regulator [Paenibacillus montaniterrae]GIP16599.1 transcriptional regulator [Paenibacillus montaniterrae]